MGSRFISRKVQGYSMEDAFRELHDDDEERYGSDYYSGHFGSSYLGYTTPTNSNPIDKAAKENAKKVVAMEEENGNAYSNRVKGYDIGVVEYHIVTAKKKPVKKTEDSKPKWEQRYIVRGYGNCEKDYYSSTDKKLATEKLLEFAIKNPNNFLRLVKEPVLVKGSSLECNVDITTKTSKRKPARVPAGSVIKELHEYVFYGWVKE